MSACADYSVLRSLFFVSLHASLGMLGPVYVLFLFSGLSCMQLGIAILSELV